MAAGHSGCHQGNIENGHVMTTGCLPDTGVHRVYCNYYCDSGYRKMSSMVYCVGNETWLPANHPEESLPCRSDDGLRTTQNATSDRTTVEPLPPFMTLPTTKQPHWGRPTTVMYPEATTRRGYYKDPHLEMNVSPAIFVGAVVGGVIAVVLIVFAIFFRAHRKAHRECMERSMVCVDASNPSYPGQPNHHTDDSMFRGIAQRIMSNAHQPPGGGNQTSTGTQLNPPPYESIPPTNATYSSVPEEHAHNPSQPYTAIDSVHPVFPPNPTLASNDGLTHWNMRGHVPNVLIGDTDEPPPYEESIKTTDQSFQGNSCHNTKTNDHNNPPPPPYSDC